MLFSVTSGINPVNSRLDIADDIDPRTGCMLVDTWLSGEPGAFRSALSHLVLSAVALGTILLAVIAGMTILRYIVSQSSTRQLFINTCHALDDQRLSAERWQAACCLPRKFQCKAGLP